MTQMNLSMTQKHTHGLKRTDLWLPRGKGGWRRDGLEFGISRRKALYTEHMHNRVLHRELYSISCDTSSSKEGGKESIYNRTTLLKADQQINYTSLAFGLRWGLINYISKKQILKNKKRTQMEKR